MSGWFVLALTFLLALFSPDSRADSYHGLQRLQTLSAENVAEQQTFYGLASYYNGVTYYLVDDAGEVQVVEPNGTYPVQGWFVVAGRHRVIAATGRGLTVDLDGQNFSFLSTEPDTIRAHLLPKGHQLAAVDARLDALRYAHLWSWLALLSKGIEAGLRWINELVGDWGLTVVAFALLMSVALSPVGLLTGRLQRRVNDVRAQLEPELKAIKAEFDGEEAHNRIMAAHKKFGVSPFYALKPSVGLFVQVPVLVGVFNVLGELPSLSQQGFFWIDDLALPDLVWSLPVTIPGFGPLLHGLPFAMALLAILAGFLYRNPQLTPAALASQRRSTFLMAILFLLLFYPFPAAMVLYWTLANMLQILQRQILGT